MRKILLLLSFLFTIAISAQSLRSSLASIYKDFEIENDKLKTKYLSQKISKPENTKESAKDEEEYKANYEKYLLELEPFKQKKLQSLEELINELEKKNALIGVVEISKAPISPNVTDDINIAYRKISNEISRGFPSEYFMDDGGYFKTNMTFTVDSDGTMKNIKAKGSNIEFNKVVTIFMYTLKQTIKPQEKDGKYILTNYNLPIVLNIE